MMTTTRLRSANALQRRQQSSWSRPIGCVSALRINMPYRPTPFTHRANMEQIWSMHKAQPTRSNRQADIEQLEHTSCTCILNSFAKCLLDDCSMFAWSCKRGIIIISMATNNKLDHKLNIVIHAQQCRLFHTPLRRNSANIRVGPNLTSP